jgi:DNA-binding transcriptional ArsR family regulator
MRKELQELQAEVLGALGHPNRVRIVEFLRSGEQCVCKILPALGLEQSNLSRHLKALKEVGILEGRKEGVSVYYKVSDPRIFRLLDLSTGIIKREIENRSKILTVA